MIRRVLGIDPGPTTGLFLLELNGGVLWSVNAAQCTYGMAGTVIDAIVQDRTDTLLAVERFVVGRKSMRAGKSGEITRDLIGALRDTYGTSVVLQTAAEAKAWGTDKRLDAAGLLTSVTGMRHAKDAARHALYAAVKHCGYPDPLSRKART